MGDKKKKKDKKRHHSESDIDHQRKKKRKRHHSSSSEDEKRKHKHKKQKKKHKKHKSSSDSGDECCKPGPRLEKTADRQDAESSRSLRPMTKEEWEKQQSVIRRVYDPDTGRTRLVKGDGEILEEIVSKSQQKEINKQATAADGQSFQRAVGLIK